MPTARSQKKTVTKKGARAKSAPVPPAKKTAKKKPAIDPTNPHRVETILQRLAEHYPNAVCALHHRNAWELMVATILSAQCTDVRVNMVTPALFKRFPTPQAMAKASQAEVEEMIRTTGFFRNKAKNIIGAAKMVVAAIRWQSSADDGRTADNPGRGEENGECCFRIMVQNSAGSGGRYARDADHAAAGTNEIDDPGENRTRLDAANPADSMD